MINKPQHKKKCYHCYTSHQIQEMEASLTLFLSLNLIMHTRYHFPNPMPCTQLIEGEHTPKLQTKEKGEPRVRAQAKPSQVLVSESSNPNEGTHIL